MGLPEADRGPVGGWPPGLGGASFLGSLPIAGGFGAADSVPSGAGGAGLGVAVGGGGTGPSATGLRSRFEDTGPLGIAMSGSMSTAGVAGASTTCSSATTSGVASTGAGSAGAGAASAGASGATAAAGSGVSGVSTAGSASAAAGFFAGAFFAAFWGGFLVDTAAFFFAGAFFSSLGASSSGGVSRIRPSRSALRRTRSACASTMLDEWLFAPIPSASQSSRVSALLSPSSRANS